ncbi:MAG: endolytic transglycosylase MltG, partial [Sedimentisphaerales bacterium]|nr:endolytic transglycosylase MltG [Sedimentisphaerales bacterium]
EREAQQKSDMKNAADVFWKRIADGMPLQSDATLAYITGKTTGQITNADKQIDSPHNTYKYAGLPAGPIGNPSLAAIDAALHPTPNPYYYFLTKADGTMVFAETLAEHNANKAKYLQ